MSACDDPPPAPLPRALGPREAASLWFAAGDRAVAAGDARAALSAFEQTARACVRANDPAREIDALLEVAAACFHLERRDDFERAVSRLDDLRRRPDLPEGVLLRARVFARIARSACGRGKIPAFFLLVHQVRGERRPGPVDSEETDVRDGAEIDPACDGH